MWHMSSFQSYALHSINCEAVQKKKIANCENKNKETQQEQHFASPLTSAVEFYLA